MKHVKHVKYILPADRYIRQIPDYNPFGKKATLRLNPDKIPHLHWSLVDSYHTTNIGLTISSTMAVSMNYIDINTLSYARGDKCKKWCGVSLSTDVNIVQNNIELPCISYMDTCCNLLLNDIIHDIPQTCII